MDPKDREPLDRSPPSNLPPVQERTREEPGQKQPRSCRFPPINAPQNQGNETVELGEMICFEERKKMEERYFLAELARIEEELREKLCMEQEREEARERERQEENRDNRRSLCYISLNQRVNRPWVFSFYRNFPMHIYCLPIKAASHRNKKRKKNFRR